MVVVLSSPFGYAGLSVAIAGSGLDEVFAAYGAIGRVGVCESNMNCFLGALPGVSALGAADFSSYLTEAGRFDLLEAPHPKAADRERKTDDEGRADLDRARAVKLRNFQS